MQNAAVKLSQNQSENFKSCMIQYGYFHALE